MENEKVQPTGPSSLQKARGNKTVRLVVIGILILVFAYLLYSVW